MEERQCIWPFVPPDDRQTLVPDAARDAAALLCPLFAVKQVSDSTSTPAGHWLPLRCMLAMLRRVSKEPPKPGKRQPTPVLGDHKRKGSRLVPPYVALLGRPENINWVNRIIPEVIWIALLHETFGRVKGTELALDLARFAVKCAPRKDGRFFAGLSDFADLTANEKEAIVKDLAASNQLDSFHRALFPLFTYYPTCPLSFLRLQSMESQESSPLRFLKNTLQNLFDKELSGTVFVQSTVVYLAFVLDRLKVVEGLALARFPEVERYPHTELSRRIASSVRVTVLSFFGPRQGRSATWPVEFWNQGIEIEKCDLG